MYYGGGCLDGMVGKYVLNEEKGNDLKWMVRRYLGEYGDYEKEDKLDKIGWDKKELEGVCDYGCEDSDYSVGLMVLFEKKVIELGLYNSYGNLMMSGCRVLSCVEKNGLYVDRGLKEELLDW